MAHYRLSHVDVSARMELAWLMLHPSRPWGLVTRLAETYGVSRKFLYDLRNRAEEVVLDALTAQPPGPKPSSLEGGVDRVHLQRAIVTLATAVPGSLRGIQVCLEEILGIHRSVGFLSQTLQQVGERAAAQNQKLSPPQPVLGEADEIFQGHQPCLTVVDGRSFLVLQLSPQPSRDATTWGVSFLELQEQGIEFQDIACDGALGIRSGVEQAGLSIPLRWDLFHVIREAHRLARRLETAAYRAMEQTEKVRRAEAEAHAPKRRRGRPLKVNQSLTQAQQHEQTAIDRYDLFVWLQRELRAVLEPWTSTCTLTCPTHAQQTLEVVVTLLQELGDAHISQYAQTIEAQQEELIAPLRWVVTQLMPWRQAIDPKQEALIIWAFKHRHTLEIEDPTQGFPQDQHPLVNAFWETLSLFHRSSSLAESLHSWLRPYLQVHRGMPPWLMALLQLYWNHHRFQRGIRKGNTPLELAGVNEESSWSEVLDHLLEDQEQQPIHTERKAA